MKRVIGYTEGEGVGPELFARVFRELDIPSSVSFKRCSNLMEAVNRAQRGEIQGLVTGPVHKASLQKLDGQSYAGQTEFLHAYLGVDEEPPLMVFIGGPFVLGLATVHLPISKVSDALTKPLLRAKLHRLLKGSSEYFKKPPQEVRVAILGLNPHAGESGLLGTEEIEVIEPVVAEFQNSGYRVRGPLSADGFWLHHQGQYDAVFSMYHDQGLGPYKLLAAGKAANVTWGLRIPRTSPAHGTADELVGTGLADSGSLETAIRLIV
ncbi:MAG: 4-hydroxythreonine-4-phosphate dehydrogenase PdxA [Myxococcaceae bacterium]|nr:4-hydroxythreonine-4-phosphate dehydrogenase PdxA [Myxococcaceae bacterium]MBH2006874.1 4-hydroxythreonine-4-phosphate dehydrogenase PdxA [Myxococcaceae bacterium]